MTTLTAPSEAAFYALVTLPLDLKAPIVLHELRGLSIGEVAASLNLPEETVKARITRGMARIEHTLREIEMINRHGKLAA